MSVVPANFDSESLAAGSADHQRSMGKSQPGRVATSENFTLTAHQDLGTKITLHRLLGLCLAENARRMAEYDSRLKRPRLVPAIARALLRVIPGRM